ELQATLSSIKTGGSVADARAYAIQIQSEIDHGLDAIKATSLRIQGTSSGGASVVLDNPEKAPSYSPRSDNIEVLVLSGGGFRATFHHVGVLICLRRLAALSHVSRLIGVSGGSIAAAHLAKSWPTIAGDGRGLTTAAAELVSFARSNPRNNAIV